MIFGPAAFISRMSQYLTLYPGDIEWMGTEGTPENLKHGDTVEIEIRGPGRCITRWFARAGSPYLVGLPKSSAYRTTASKTPLGCARSASRPTMLPSHNTRRPGGKSL